MSTDADDITPLDDLPLFAAPPSSAPAGRSPRTPAPTDTPVPRTIPTPARTQAADVLTGAADRDFWRTVTALRSRVADLQAAALTFQSTLDASSREELGRAHIVQVVRDHSDALLRNGQPPLTTELETRLVKALFDAMYRLGRLQPLVELDGVVNIEIDGHDRVLVIYADGRHEYAPPVADSNADLIADLAFLASRDPDIERSFTRSNPFLEMPLPGHARLAALSWVTPWPRVTIRMQHLKHVELSKLRENNTIDGVLESFLTAAVRAKKSLIISGEGQGSGKTTLLRALAAAIPTWTSVATIETDYELYLHEEPARRNRVLPLQARVGSGEQTASGGRAGEITTMELVYRALRHNIDRIIVGEVRGPEIVAMFEAMQGGNGSMSTVHADSARDVIERLVGLAVKDSRLSETYAYRQIAQSIDLIVHLSVDERPDGSRYRYVSQVIEVTPGEQHQPVAVSDLFIPGPDGRAVPASNPTFLNALVRAGFDQSLLTYTEGTWGPR
ncbi:CpaF family protein [uncultured Cellulomonas sp.]|uniref:CpaF family protein n=1 Tax=uncultured Cellulomonas sp. TaxID=189682 RepID=UPI00262C29AF|nr:CpaF/VirB11 family protein [uncultured Cellulomonas sp.]